MTTATLTKPMGEWFTQLDAETQADITEMVNENGYPLDDIQDFIETHGAKAYTAGHYATWCQITEELGVSNEVIEAFVEEFGIDCIDGFEDSYCGTYSSGAEYARELVEGGWNMDNIPGFVEIDWEATWDNLSQDYTEVDGHIFCNRY
jgi:antirestriction protein